MTLSSYYNDDSLKTELVKLAHQHRAADLYEQGTYGVPGEFSPACSVGCTVRDYNRLRGARFPPDTHAGLADALAIPPALAELNEHVFEGLRPSEAPDWPPAFLDALPVGATYRDLNHVAKGAIDAARLKVVELTGLDPVGQLYAYRDLVGRAEPGVDKYDVIRAARDAVLELLRQITPAREGADDANT